AAAVLVRAGGPGKLVGNAYDAFLSPERPNATDLNRRLVSLSGSGRVDYWRVAWRQYRENPLLGSGAGSYERYWIRDRPNAFYARNAHNLYLEVLVPPVAFVFVLQVGNTAIARAASAAGHGDFGRAEASARRAEQWAPWSYEPWQFLGETQLATRNLGAARRSFRTAISKDTQNWRLWFDLAEASKGRVRQ